MEYYSICCICGRKSPSSNTISEHSWTKEKAGYIQVQTQWAFDKIRKLNFCSSCAEKSYTIEELKTVGSYNDWSY